MKANGLKGAAPVVDHRSDMTAGRRAESGGTGGSTSPPASSALNGRELCVLGEALNARTADVLTEVITRRRDPGPVTGAGLVEGSLEQICTISTRAVALWMMAGDPKAAVETGRKRLEDVRPAGRQSHRAIE